MLDKSLPYKNIIMKLDYRRNMNLVDPSLPDGFSFTTFKKGNEYQWAEIECSVLEFDSKEKAIEYFSVDYLSRMTELEKRCLFVVNQQGKPVATATAWWVDYEGRHQASLHWVAVHPDYQRKGLGKAIVSKALSLFPVYEKGQDIYLHTQTWSHVAIGIYYKFGFHLLKTDTLGRMGNDYEEAIEIVKDKLDPEMYQGLIETAE